MGLIFIFGHKFYYIITFYVKYFHGQYETAIITNLNSVFLFKFLLSSYYCHPSCYGECAHLVDTVFSFSEPTVWGEDYQGILMCSQQCLKYWCMYYANMEEEMSKASLGQF